MIKAINFLGETPAAATVAAPQPAVKAEDAAVVPQQPAQDTFVPSAPKAKDAPKADPNDKFEKAEEKKSED